MDHDHDHHGHDQSEGEERAPGIPADQIDRAFPARPRPDVVGVEIEREMLLVDGATGAVRHLDAIGSVVWQCLDGEATIDEISADLAAGFKADPAVVSGDVLDLVRILGGQGLLDGVDPDLPPQVQEPTGFPTGTELPSFRLDTLEGGTFDLGAERGHRLLLVNWSPRCGFCDQIAPDLAEYGPELEREGIKLVLLSIGNREDNEEKLARLGLRLPLALKEDLDPALDPFPGTGTPSAYLLDEQGRTASELSVGAFNVPGFIREAAGVSTPEVEVEEPEPEPNVEDDRARPKFLIEPKST